MDNEYSLKFGYSDQHVFDVVTNAWIKCKGREKGFVNYSEALVGLQKALSDLHPVVPLPRKYWYRIAFDNFDDHRTGFITFYSFRQIIQQFHRYHAQKNREAAENEAHKEQTSGETYNSGTELSNSFQHEDLNSFGASKYKEEDQADAIEQSQSSYGSNIEFVSSFVFPSHKGIQQITEDYDIGKKCLGEGAFSRVYLARHRQTGQLRVCKTIDITCSQQWEFIKQEINLMRSLNHPNILRLHEAYDGGCTIFLILELCRGGPLYSRILKLKEPLMEEQIAVWMKQIISATAFCHERGIVHRDIKPENILFVNVSDTSPLKVIDFGLSSTLDKLWTSRREIFEKRQGMSAILAKMLLKIQGKPMDGNLVKRVRMQCAGTPHYMAPEMIKGMYNEKCDIFSVGVIMYQLLSGKHPFFGAGCNNQQMLRDRILHKNPCMDQDEWKAVSRHAIHLVKWMLQKDPRKRCSAKEALDHVWFKIVGKPNDLCKSQLTPSVFEGLKQWQQLTGFKRAIVRLLASELGEEQIYDLRKKFEIFDRTGDGTITLEELKYSVRLARYTMIEEDIERIFESLDISRSNRIYYMEFISALFIKRNHIEKAQLKHIFRKFDVHGEGRITIDAFRMTLKHSKYGKLLEEDLEAIFNEIDLNRDGYVDFFEFYQLLTS